MKKPPRNIEIDEVVPPGKASSGEPLSSDAIARLVAHVMDNLFKVPGTERRFGIDPLLGLLPYFGDSIANLISAAVLSQGARSGVPKIVLARMALNVLLNALVGAIPLVGDAFSFWFKSNARNYALLQRHARSAKDSTKGDWAFVIGLIVVLVAVILGIVVFATIVIAAAIKTLFGG